MCAINDPTDCKQHNGSIDSGKDIVEHDTPPSPHMAVYAPAAKRFPDIHDAEEDERCQDIIPLTRLWDSHQCDPHAYCLVNYDA